MTMEDVVGGIFAVALIGYLLYALLFPERLG